MSKRKRKITHHNKRDVCVCVLGIVDSYVRYILVATLTQIPRCENTQAQDHISQPQVTLIESKDRKKNEGVIYCQSIK